jgi:hypothetical protein
MEKQNPKMFHCNEYNLDMPASKTRAFCARRHEESRSSE